VNASQSREFVKRTKQIRPSGRVSPEKQRPQQMRTTIEISPSSGAGIPRSNGQSRLGAEGFDLLFGLRMSSSAGKSSGASDSNFHRRACLLGN
jgi:hypothetical protein